MSNHIDTDKATLSVLIKELAEARVGQTVSERGIARMEQQIEDLRAYIAQSEAEAR